ncbi:transmembrane 4 L6 family member 1-like [Lacerta agilis]|uniref:transmembrane 4 L6 family member 1-like n=1 Tax=Lacerta agilis TaxID=80427 RepID=UPI0014198ADE|nr:transmembrane 4 L6 family member 1-like [Lacerta agilis]
MVPAVHIQATGRKGCCGNRCGMFLSIIFAAVGALGAVYAVATSSLGLVHGPLCQYPLANGTLQWGRPFESSLEDFSEKNYLFDTSLWDVCRDPPGVIRFNIILFSLILASGLVEFCLCVLQVLNGLFGCVCGTCNEEEKETYH